MAAVQRDRPRLISPPGYEVADKGFALDDFLAGDPVIISPIVAPSRQYDFSVARSTGAEAHGFALKDCKAGGTVEFARQAEISGFIGLVPGAPLSIVAGNLDTTAPTGQAQIRARNDHSIYFNLV
jgi:hypothetical protein